MRHKLLFLMVLACCFTPLVGCGGNTETTAPTTDELSQFLADNPEEATFEEDVDEEEDD